MSDRRDRILAVDDKPENIRLLEAILGPAGYEVIGASSGEEALAKVATDAPDLILADIVMPGMSGYELCRRLRADPATAFLPIVTITASGHEEKKEALQAGADDYVAKPFDKTELLARVRSLLRLKHYHDTVERQKRQLSRFLSPQIADIVSSEQGEALLAGHRREITVVFCDLRGFTAFSETAEPEEALALLRSYQGAMGEEIFRHKGTLEHFAGDGLMTWFNDPLPQEGHQLLAVKMALAMRERFDALAAGWRKKGYELGFGVGVATGYATLGRIGFEGRHDYGAVGNVVILAARLCSAAASGQILVSQRLYSVLEDQIEVASVGELTLKGLTRPVPALNVTGLKPVPA
jgi:class 3 adenylate cyclase